MCWSHTHRTILPQIKRIKTRKLKSHWLRILKKFNNQGIEGQNRDIKASFTFRKKMPLGSFSDCVLKMVHEWSLSTKYSTIGADRKQKLRNNPDSLKLRSNGYNWFMDHKIKLRWNQNCWKTNKNTKMFCIRFSLNWSSGEISFSLLLSRMDCKYSQSKTSGSKLSY